MSSRARRTDGNHRSLLDLAKQLGAKVIDIHAVPGAVDAIVLVPVRYRIEGDYARFESSHTMTQIELWELKSPKGKLRPSQQALIDAGWPIRVVKTEDDVLNALGVKE